MQLLQADLNVEQALDHYIVEAPHMTLSFLDAPEKAYPHIQRQTRTGSPHSAEALDIPGLRFWPCQRFP